MLIKLILLCNCSGKDALTGDRSTIAADTLLEIETISTPNIGRSYLGSGKNTQ
tara:strand:- start:1510 stop:1668 length:159 start_codon:yes stop_codon:yes gene_type:complete